MYKTSDHAAAAAQIRAELKRLGIKGSVRSKSYSGGSSVTAYVTDLPPAIVKELTAFVHQYEYGSFDGSTDSYHNDNRHPELPQVRYTFVTNTISDELTQKIWDYCRGYFSGLEQLPVDAIEADACYRFIQQQGCYAKDLIHRVANGSWGEFWTVAKAA